MNEHPWNFITQIEINQAKSVSRMPNKGRILFYLELPVISSKRERESNYNQGT